MAASLKAWWGTRGAVTPLHYDSQHNVYAQLHGARQLMPMPRSCPCPMHAPRARATPPSRFHARRVCPLPSSPQARRRGSTISALYLRNISAVSPLYLPYISRRQDDAAQQYLPYIFAISHLYLPCISPISPAGEKTFHLFPPEWLEAGLYLYPRTHPLSHFSRVPDPTTEPTAGTAADYPEYRGPARAPASRATLRAGDVLYLPPFWAHHAACERQCIAANVWVGSDAMLRHRAVEQARHS